MVHMLFCGDPTLCKVRGRAHKEVVYMDPRVKGPYWGPMALTLESEPATLNPNCGSHMQTVEGCSCGSACVLDRCRV